MWQVQTIQQRVDADGGNRQNGDLTQGIETTEVHQDHIDHIGATTAGDAVLEEERRNALIGTGQHRIGQHRHHGAAAQRQGQITQTTQAARLRRGTVGHEVQGENQQNDGHHLYRQLGQRQIRRRETGEGQCHHQAGSAEDHQRHQATTMEDHGEYGGDHQNQHAGDGHRIERGHRHATGQLLERRQRDDHQSQGTAQHPGQIALLRAAFQQHGDAHGQARHVTHHLIEGILGIQVGQSLVPAEQRFAAGVDDDPTEQRNETHQQRQVEAVPDGQAVLRQLATQGRSGGGGQQRRYRVGWHDADQQAEEHQHLNRHFHVARWLVRRVLGQVDRLAVEEYVMDEAQRVGHREHAGQGCRCRNHPVETAQQVLVQGFSEEHFLAQKTVEQRHASHSRSRHHRQHGRMWHVLPQAVYTPHVAAAGFVVDDARGHEQRGLESGMVDDVEHRRHGCQLGIQAEQQRDQPQVTDGRVRQQPLQIMLEQCHDRTDQQGGQPGHADHVEPPVGASQRRVQARQQKYTGLDHGCRVQIGRNRRWRCHRMGQPEVEGELRRLGEHAQQHQYQRQRIQLMCANRVTSRQHLRQLEAAGDMADQQDAGEQRQTTAAGDRQRHARALAGFGARTPEADQQERRQAGQLPEHQHQQQVFREHHTEHGAHEQQQESEETPHRLGLGQVITGVEDHQQTDAENQQGEQETQAIEAQAEVQAKMRQPLKLDPQHFTGKYR